MSKFGDFTHEAYQALREAYANEANNPIEEENTGYNLAGQNYGLETVDARGEYLDKTGLWRYPTGTTDYEKPDPESLVTALQNEDDEDLDALIDEILNEVEDDDEHE